MLRLRVCELEAEVNKHQQEGEQLARLREELELQRKNYEEQHNTTLRELAEEREAVVQSRAELQELAGQQSSRAAVPARCGECSRRATELAAVKATISYTVMQRQQAPC